MHEIQIMATAASKLERARALTAERGILRPRDLVAHGLPAAYMRALEDEGLVERVRRGVYIRPDADLTIHESLLEVAVRVPSGVICLASAVRFHGLGTQDPARVWLALPRGARTPARDLRLRVVRLSPAPFAAGIEGHPIAGVELRVYGVAKTIADCFKFRGKVGLDVALEALREGWRERRFSLDELWRYAELNRVARVMQPYLEMLTCGI
jgi:predicted transcriptional regulator of viral defense system